MPDNTGDITTAPSPRQAEVLAILSDYGEPLPTMAVARIMRYKHDLKSVSYVYALLGALQNKGLAELVDGRWTNVR